MDGIVVYAVAARYQSHDATDVTADVIYLSGRETVLQIPADQLVLAQGDYVQAICIVRFEVALRARSGAVQIVLQLRRNFYARKQSVTWLKHGNFSFVRRLP